MPGGVRCEGELLRHCCGSPAYRDLFRRMAAGEVASGPPTNPAPPPPAHSADQFRNAASCPHRERIPEGERIGCGCRFRCAAGQSDRPGGAVDVLSCWACPIAPRRNWPA